MIAAGLIRDDSARTLTIGERQGRFPVLIQSRRYRVVDQADDARRGNRLAIVETEIYGPLEDEE